MNNNFRRLEGKGSKNKIIIIHKINTTVVTTLSVNGIKMLMAALVMLSSLIANGVYAQQTFDGWIKNNSLAVSPDENIAVASYSDSTCIKIYDLKSGELIKNLLGFVNPRNILFSPDGKWIYITDSGLGELLIFNAGTFEIKMTYPVGYGAFGTAITNNGKLIFINNEAASTVTVIDLEEEKVRAVITGFAQPRQGVKLNAENSKLYVTNFANNKIVIVDVKTLRIDKSVSGFNAIRAISIEKNGSTLYAANSGTNSIYKVDLRSNRITDSVKVGRDPYGAALSPDEKILLSGNKADNTLSIVDIKSFKVTGTINGFNEPRQAIVFSKDGEHVYVLNADLSVNAVDLAEKKIVKKTSFERGLHNNLNKPL